MNSRVIIAVIGLLACATICCGDESDSQSRATNVASKAMDSVKKVANKGAERVEKAADGITVKVERFVNPEPHQPGNSNLLVSAGRGVGRLLRNVTVEVARAAGSVGSSAVNLVKNTSTAARDTVRQAASRIANPRGAPTKEPAVEASSASSESSSEAAAEPEPAKEADGQAPAELTKTEE